MSRYEPAYYGPFSGMPASGTLVSSCAFTEGYPDKLCDIIADSILDACLADNSDCRVNCKVTMTTDRVALHGGMDAGIEVDPEAIARNVMQQYGRNRTDKTVCIANGIEALPKGRPPDSDETALYPAYPENGGIVSGFATDETRSLLPLPLTLARAITQRLSAERGRPSPVGYATATVQYEDDRPCALKAVQVSLVTEGRDANEQEAWIRDAVIPVALGKWMHKGVAVTVNPSGTASGDPIRAQYGGSRSLNASETYGGAGRHKGDPVSGMDPSRIIRSGSYYCRHVARRIVQLGLARQVEVYCVYNHRSLYHQDLAVNAFGTGNDAAVLDFIKQHFAFDTMSIAQHIGLCDGTIRYADTARFGHFGQPVFPWETPDEPAGADQQASTRENH